MRLKAVLICLASGMGAAVVACGDDGGARKLPDAAPLDDSGTPDTPLPPQPVRITITNDGVAQEGVDVYFQNPDFSLVAKVATDANGTAQAVVMPGAYVTAVNPFPPPVLTGLASDDLQTYAGVQPGDSLLLSQGAPPLMLTNFDVVADLDPNASQYRVWSTCMGLGSGGWPLAVGSGGERPQAAVQLENCGTKTDVLVESEDGLGVGVGYIFKDDAPVAAAAAGVDVTGPYTATPTVTLQYTNVPANVFNISATNLLATSDGPLWQEFVGVGSGGVTSATFNQPAPAGATQVYITSLATGVGVTDNLVIDWQPITTAPTFSLATALMHPVTGSPRFDVATSSLVWDHDGTMGESPDLAIAVLTANRAAPAQSWTWRLVGPVTGPALKYPTLPTAIERLNPIEGDTLSSFNFQLAKVPGGYNTVRAIALSKDFGTFFVGASGRALVQRYLD